MSIAKLSGDTLSEIFGWLDIPHLSRVFLLGNRAFYSKIIGTKALNRVQTRCIIQQRQEKPLISQATFAGLSRLSQIRFLAQFTCIRHLSLDFSGHPVICDQVDSILSLQLVSLTLKIHGAGLVLYDTTLRQVRRLDQHFPSMTTLELMDLSSFAPRQFTDDTLEQIGRRLPHSLTRLQMGVFWRPPLTLLKQLPDSITDISIAITECRWDPPTKLSPNVKKMELLVTSTTPLSSSVNLTDSLPAELLSMSVLPLPGKSASNNASYLRFDERMKIPPHLTSLKLPYERSITSTGIKCLPDTLTELVLRHSDAITDEGIAALPRGLQRLEIGATASTGHAFSLLPPNLTVLKCGFTILDTELKEMASIPRTVTTFVHFKDRMPFEEPIGLYLPSTLRKLKANLRPVSLQLLPSTLETLSFKNRVTIRDTHDLELPTGLKKLEFTGRIDYTQIQHSHVPFYFPSTLTHLHISGDQLIRNPSDWGLLPQTMTYLYIGSHLTTEILPLLPSSLKHFFAKTIIIVRNVTAMIVEQYDALISQPPSAMSFGSKLFKSSTKAELYLHADDFFNMAKSLVPRNITTVPCRNFALPVSTDLLAPLPPTLAKLDLSLSTTHLADPELSWLIGDPLQDDDDSQKEVDQANRLCGFHRSHSEKLAGLKSLIMRPPSGDKRFCTHNFAFGIEDAEALPPSLTHLEIDWNLQRSYYLQQERNLHEYAPDVFGSNEGTPSHFEPLSVILDCTWLSRLPHLVHLTTTWNSEFSGYLPLLPQTMHTLQCDGATLTAEDFALLPPKLTHLASKDCICENALDFAQLPRLLKRWRLQSITLQGPCTSLLISATPNAGMSSFYSHWTQYLRSTATDPLPLELTEFDLTGHAVSDTIFSRIHPGVTRLSLLDNYNITTSSISQWPSSLTSLKLGSLLFGDEDLNLLPKDLGVLDWPALLSVIKQRAPSSLTELEVEVKGCPSPLANLSLIPAAVKTIELDCRQGLWHLDFATLPKSLEVYRVQGRFAQGSSLRNAPPTLQELCAPTLSLADSHISSIPSSLTFLDLSQSEKLTDACFSALPRQLVHLNLASLKCSDTRFSSLPPHLKFLSLGMTTISGTHLARLETVTIFTLISSVQATLPRQIENQPILEWEVEIPTILQKIDKETTLHVILPAERIEPAVYLAEMEADVAYSCPAPAYSLDQNQTSQLANTRPSLAPATKAKPVAQIERTLRYQIVDPSGASSPLTLYWNIPKSHNFDLKSLPTGILTFSCCHLRIPDSALAGLPHSLQALGLPQSTQLTIRVLPSLPKSITDLELSLEGFHPKKQRLKESCPASVLQDLPPLLSRFVIGSSVYVGEKTEDLARD